MQWCLAFLMMAISSIAIAGESVMDKDGTILTLPYPAYAKKLFNPIEEAKDPICPTKAEVIKHYVMSASDLKSGKVQLLAGDLPQAFSNEWRHRLGVETVTVSSVVAQPLDLSRLGGGSAFDVTEFGANGCAFSRTIMSAAIWAKVLRAAIGVSI